MLNTGIKRYISIFLIAIILVLGVINPANADIWSICLGADAHVGIKVCDTEFCCVSNKNLTTSSIDNYSNSSFIYKTLNCDKCIDIPMPSLKEDKKSSNIYKNLNYKLLNTIAFSIERKDFSKVELKTIKSESYRSKHPYFLRTTVLLI